MLPSRTLALAAALLLAGCGTSGPVTDGTTDSGTTTPQPTVPPPQVVREVRVNAYVAWDADEARVVAPTIDGDPATSALVLTLSADPEGEPAACTVVIDLEGTTAAPPSKGPQWQLDLAADQGRSVASDCTEAGFLPEQFPDDDPAAYWGNLPWKLTVVGSELSGELSAALGDVGIDAATVLQGRRDGEEPFALREDDPLAALSYWQGYALVDGDVTTSSGRFANAIAPEALDGLPAGELPTGYWVFDDLVVTPLPDTLQRARR